MAIALLDSSAIVGYLDAGDPFHASAVAAVERVLRASDRLAISVISWAELMTGAKRGHHEEHAVREFVEELAIIVLSVNRPIAERAAEVRARERSLKMPDALILATADVNHHIATAIGADDRWPRVKGLSVEIVGLTP